MLEVGCGTGVQTERLLRDNPGIELVALDVSAASLTRARARVPVGVTFVEADVTRLPDDDFADGSFDHVYCCFVLEHLAGPAGVLGLLRRLLRPGGTLTAIEGDHGSTFFHPDDAAAREVGGLPGEAPGRGGR